jgi:hypothetical protein
MTEHTCMLTQTTVDGSIPPPCPACLEEMDRGVRVTFPIPTLPYHKTLWAAYVYNGAGTTVVAWHVFTTEIEATAWAYEEAIKWSKLLPPAVARSPIHAPTDPPSPLPCCTRMYTVPDPDATDVPTRQASS